MSSKIAMVTLAVGFTIFLSALAGFDRVDRRSVDLMRSFGAGPVSIFWRLRLPAALPLIAAGMRVATVRSLIVAIYIDSSRLKRLDHVGPHFSVQGPLNIGRSPQGQPVVLQAGGSAPGLELAARTADVVFSVVQDFDEARTQYAALKQLLPRYGRKAEEVTVLPGVMPIVARTEREAFDRLAMLQS